MNTPTLAKWLVSAPRTRRGLITTRIIQGVVVLLLSFTCLVLVSHHANAAPPTVPHPRTHPFTDSPQVYGHKMSHAKTHHKLGNSKGRYLPAKFVHRLDHYADAHPKRDILRWWVGVGHRGECAWNSLLFPGPIPIKLAFCAKYGDYPTISKLDRKITEVHVLCGAAAVAGALRGGGVAGAAIGGGLCGFTAAAGFALDVLPRQAHHRHLAPHRG